MFDPKVMRDAAKQFVEQLSPGVKAVNKDIEEQLQQFLQNWFNKLSLVTREEFDIQTQVLMKTRLKLEQLETAFKALEQKFNTEGTIVPPDVP